MRIGLLGGSFNPAHEGHLHVSQAALKRLRLDQVWWLVSPQNPLKSPRALPPLAERLRQARETARHPRIRVTGFEAALPDSYTVTTLSYLRRRFPETRFVWLMGADNLADFHRWRGWRRILALAPAAVIDRPGFRYAARGARAAQCFARAYLDESDAAGLAALDPPGWTLLSVPLNPTSSTALRTQQR